MDNFKPNTYPKISDRKVYYYFQLNKTRALKYTTKLNH